jgi:hypothetical protein
MYQGEDTEWVLTHGHEYVRNLEIVEPLGIHTMSDLSTDGYGEYLGFIARVPEALAAPHEPEVLVGGVSYPSENVEGETVNCEYSLMSAPCLCDTPIAWGEDSEDIILGDIEHMYFTGGCPPFSWTGNNVSFVNSAGIEIEKDILKKTRDLYVKSNDECSGSVKVYEVCGGNLSKEKSIIGYSGSVIGDSILEPGETATYFHNLGHGATYTGTLPCIVFNNEVGQGIVCTMPANCTPSSEYPVSFSGACGAVASTTVQCLDVLNCPFPYEGCGTLAVGTIVTNPSSGRCVRVKELDPGFTPGTQCSAWTRCGGPGWSYLLYCGSPWWIQVTVLEELT